MPASRSCATTSGPGRDHGAGTGACQQTLREGMIGERTIRIDASRDDLAHRDHQSQIHALEGGHDGLVRGREGRGVGHQPDVAMTIAPLPRR